MRKHILPTLLILGAIWFLYFQTGSFEFLRLDDHDYTFRCPFVRDGLSWANLCAAFSNFRHAAIWMPITYLSYMTDISLFGPGMGAHHLVNVGIHAFNAILLYCLLITLLQSRQSARRRLLATLAVLFWALHPQRAEAVAWIAGRKELLCATFVLLGLLCASRRTLCARLGTVFFCALACMSKPTAMCFPFLLFAEDLILDRLPPRDAAAGWRRLVAWIRPYWIFLLMAIATGALAVYSQTHAEGYAVRELFSASFAWRLLNAIVAVGLSVFQTILPVGIHLDYRAVPGKFPVDGTLGLSAACLALAVLVWLWFRKSAHRADRQLLVAPVLFFFASLTPTLGIFGSFGEHARADRFLYIPTFAFSLAFVLFLPPLLDRLGLFRRRLLLVTSGFYVFAVLVASFPVVASYQNDYTAFSRTLLLDPRNGRALAHVASEECARFGHIDKGISLYRESQKVRPRDDTASQLAYALALRGLSSDYQEIRDLCSKFACDHSLDRKGQALEALGTTAMRQRKWAEAISCLEDSIRAPLRFYSSEDARLRLAACYCNAKRPDDAIRILEPLTQSTRTDISDRARQALGTIKKNPKAILFF